MDLSRPKQISVGWAVGALGRGAGSFFRPQWGLVPWALGLLLLTAGGLKGYALATAPPVEQGLLTARWFLTGLVVYESLLGLWLLSGWQARRARQAALATFSAFLVAAVSHAAAGASSCACFGPLHLSPWFAVILDLAAITALWAWVPNPGDAATAPASWLFFGTAVLVGLLALIPLVLLSRSSGTTALEASPPVLDMGEVPPGGAAEVEFTLRNGGAAAVAVPRVESSCPCLTVRAPGRIEPHPAGVAVRARLDLAREPAFVGDLDMTVRGRAADGTTAFTVLIKVKVRPG